MNNSELVSQVDNINELLWDRFSSVQDDFKFHVDRVIMPWFSKWLKWEDEIWLYTIKDARKEFWKKIPNIDQFKWLEGYLDEKWNPIDLEDVFHIIIWMHSRAYEPYFIESGKSILRDLWIKW
jgi:hypothetical protein